MITMTVSERGWDGGSKVVVRKRRRKWGKRTQKAQALPPLSVDENDSSESDSSDKTTAGSIKSIITSKKNIEILPQEIMLQILPFLRPIDVIHLFNSSPSIKSRIDHQQLWKGCWYWLADEFSGAVTVHRLLSKVSSTEYFDWKMLVLLDWRFQYKGLTYKTVRSTAKDWCTKIREVCLVLNTGDSAAPISKIHNLLQALKGLDSIDTDDAVSTEDEYDHDKDWEMAIVSGMAFSGVRREVISSLNLPPDINIDNLSQHYEILFQPYKPLVGSDCASPADDDDAF
eukprot:TRINITY_DN15270_c0_g1_i1.p1 TRINITY_DN15270_c0_g1~~TRINITY_DN15270_c0_g1_i1.p1  ORF type:complete len:285 (+),score=45.47 TRINITY_DN15270_c0_g1_i1:74-928(+)